MMIQTSFCKLYISLGVIWTLLFFFICVQSPFEHVKNELWKLRKILAEKTTGNRWLERDWGSLKRSCKQPSSLECEHIQVIRSGISWTPFSIASTCARQLVRNTWHFNYNDHDVQLSWLLSKMWQLLIIVHELISKYFIDNWHEQQFPPSPTRIRPCDTEHNIWTNFLHRLRHHWDPHLLNPSCWFW